MNTCTPMFLEVWSFLLIFSRVAALLVTAPVLGSRSVPSTVKIGMAGLFSLALMPMVARQIAAIPADLLTLIGQIAAETVVGMCLGFLVTLLFTAFEIAGHF